MADNLEEFRGKVYSELSDIKTDVKLICNTQESMSETIKELKDVNKGMQVLMTKQTACEDDVHDLYKKFNNLPEKCAIHDLTVDKFDREIEELKNALKARDKYAIGFLMTIFAFITVELIKIIH